MGIHVFGLTGGLASGKSTVGRMFRARGVPVIDADLLAREVVERGSEGLAAVVAAFGEQILAPDGTMDRAKVAELVFQDPARRRTLNGILHPRIGALSAQRMTELAAAGHELACYEAALLVENRLVEMFRPLVVVAVPEAVQIERAMTRDGATEEQAKARIASQLPLAEKVAVADIVIDTQGPLPETEKQVDAALAKIRERLKLT
ncbi:MAG: dephospho-CoA kinase [Polyangiaceae bacterium]